MQAPARSGYEYAQDLPVRLGAAAAPESPVRLLRVPAASRQVRFALPLIYFPILVPCLKCATNPCFLLAYHHGTLRHEKKATAPRLWQRLLAGGKDCYSERRACEHRLEAAATKVRNFALLSARISPLPSGRTSLMRRLAFGRGWGETNLKQT